ncbi:MAG: hypothetical protein GF390_02030 [Candidatus Pacebacteria bacterium]|nr:hypothetical protein [Candidatus Paceibacterota bacterium]
MLVFIIIIILSFLILIHELGHFLVAKWNQVKIEEFGLGYPPRAMKLFSWQGTLFSLNWIPFGGFVKLEGEDGPNDVKQAVKQKAQQLKTKLTKGTQPFYLKSARARLAIVFAGALINFIFGMLAFSLLFSATGIPTSLQHQPRISQVATDSPAAQANLPTQANITGLEIDGQLTKTTTIQEVQQVVEQHLGQQVIVFTTGPCEQLSCQDQQQQFELYLRPPQQRPDDQGAMGVVFSDFYFKFYPWYEMPIRGAIYGVMQALLMGWLMITTLAQIFRDLVFAGQVPADLAGPVGIVDHAQQQDLLSTGWQGLLSFAGILSINLAVMNILPIPGLDGGRAVFILLEKLVGKSKVQKIEGYANYGGFMFLVALLILITLRDVWRILSHG